jgi:hypothetical protein
MNRLVRALLAGVVALTTALGVGAVTPSTASAAADTSVMYAGSSASVANPERGFYHQREHCDRDAFNASTLTSYRTQEQISLVMCIFYLAEFKTTPISAAKLTWFDQQAAKVRAAGLKMVVRFAYTDDQHAAVTDAAPSQVLAHIDQLAPKLRANADVIDVVQSGFVGVWGEGHYSTHFGVPPNLSADDWTNREAIVTRLLASVPTTRMVQVRMPRFKRHQFGTAPVTSSAAYGTTALARVGHHNDCFLASDDDSNTYEDVAVEYPYLKADSQYVAVGGESCKVNPPRSECTKAEEELRMFHYSYLNRDHKTAVLDSWIAGGCLGRVAQRLGYRYSLTSGLYPSSVTRGGKMLVQFGVRNTGYSTAHNPRPVYLVMRNTANGNKTRVRLTSTDPRRWTAGDTTPVAQNVGIPSTMAPGTYELLLSLPDPMSKLTARPEYAIRMANGGGVWEPTTGLNRLLATVTVN